MRLLKTKFPALVVVTVSAFATFGVRLTQVSKKISAILFNFKRWQWLHFGYFHVIFLILRNRNVCRFIVITLHALQIRTWLWIPTIHLDTMALLMNLPVRNNHLGVYGNRDKENLWRLQ